MASTVDQIKGRLSILDVVGSYVKLAKAGKDFKGLSPFTKEKTPSFHVSPDRGVYYCFSTNKGGDMFTFIQEMEGVDFKGAMRILAERAGVEIVFEKPEEKDARERLYIAMEDAAVYYQSVLKKDTAALHYLERRGISPHTIESFRIGYAPTPEGGGWRPLTTHLEKKGYRRQELIEAGLAKLGKQNDLYDQFRQRIMFPLFDAAGRVVAFSGRAFPDDPEKKAPKYLNSPDTPLYHKSKFLYGYDRARSSIRKYNFSMLVEGQMDLVLSHQAGFTNTTAVSGTALTEEHLTLLKRLSDNLLLAFDSDPAGLRAGMRSAAMALKMGMDVKVAAMPLGKDPADVVRENPALLKDAVRDAAHIITFAMEVLDKNARDQRAFGFAVRKEVLPLVAAMENSIDRAQFVRQIALRLRVPEEAVRDELRKSALATAPAGGATRGDPLPRQERSRRDKLIRIIAIHIALYERDKRHEDRENLHTEFTRIAGKQYAADVEAIVKNEQEKLLFEATRLSAETPIADTLRALETEMTRVRFAEAAERLRTAEAAGDAAAIDEALALCRSLAADLAKLSHS